MQQFYFQNIKAIKPPHHMDRNHGIHYMRFFTAYKTVGATTLELLFIICCLTTEILSSG